MVLKGGGREGEGRRREHPILSGGALPQLAPPGPARPFNGLFCNAWHSRRGRGNSSPEPKRRMRAGDLDAGSAPPAGSQSLAEKLELLTVKTKNELLTPEEKRSSTLPSTRSRSMHIPRLGPSSVRGFSYTRAFGAWAVCTWLVILITEPTPLEGRVSRAGTIAGRNQGGFDRWEELESSSSMVAERTEKLKTLRVTNVGLTNQHCRKDAVASGLFSGVCWNPSIRPNSICRPWGAPPAARPTATVTRALPGASAPWGGAAQTAPGTSSQSVGSQTTSRRHASHTSR